MRRRGRWWIAGAAALPLAAVSFAGCTTTSAACDCVTPLITIHIPADIASSVTASAVLLSGPGCTNVTPRCANQTNGCTAYDFTPNGAGDCVIEVDKPSGTFKTSVSIVAKTGCCAGFYPASPSSSTISVPEPGDGG